MQLSIQHEGEFKYVEQGEGKILMLLHGLFGALSNFAGLIDHFGHAYKIVVPILPIYDSKKFRPGINDLVDYVERFVAHKGYTQINLLGNSLGGHIAQLFTLRQQHLVKSLILTGSSGLFENSFGDTFPRRGDYEYIKNKTALTFYDPNTATKELVDEVYDIVNRLDYAIRVVSVAKSAIRYNMKDQLPAIKVPTLLIWGTHDNVTPPFVADEFKKLLPNAQLIWMDKTGHAPMMERPDEFNIHLAKFLSEQG